MGSTADPQPSRRALLRAGVAGLGLPVLAAACTSRPPPSASPPSRPGPAGAPGSAYQGAVAPVSMAMHLHASFSEGRASVAAHLDQARRLGVDVLFFSEHDFRVAALGYRTELTFEEVGAPPEPGAAEPPPGEPESGRPDGPAVWHRRDTGDLRQVVVRAGRTAVLAATAGGPDPATVWLEARAWNFTYRASLADTTLELTVRPLAAGPDAYLVLEITLSHHPAAAGRPAGQPVLAYRIGAFPALRRRADGLAGVVEVPAAPGRPSALALRPVDDIAALWPELVAEDNSLFRVRLGLTVRAGATGRFAVDPIALRRPGRDRPLDLVRRVLDRYAHRYPDSRHYAALEVSLVRHLNWYGADLAIPDYAGVATPPVRNASLPAAEAMVRFIQSRGGLASYNHPLYAPPATVAEELVRARALGADIVEVAYGSADSLDAMLHVFDACARNLVFVTANGVTDDHSGLDWYANRKSNWITRAWARSADLPDLLTALRAGRAWCHKPDGWRGELELTAAGRPAMGGVLVSDDATVPVTVRATELPRGGALELVTGPTDAAAPTPATTSTVVPAARLTARGHGFDAPTGHYVRAVIRDRHGAIVGLGNPTWLLRTPPAGGVPPARQLPPP